MKIWFAALSMGIFPGALNSRSIYRTPDPHVPSLSAFWDESSPRHYLRSSSLEPWAHFDRFDKEFLFSHQIPVEPISFRYDAANSIDGEKLKQLVLSAADEILSSRRRKTFHQSTILKDADFNYSTSCGLIVILLKDAPFVVKLYRETPATFVKPYNKGILPSLFFYMAGGINRYELGFTRIKNRQALVDQLSSDPAWSQRVTFPRKWFWVHPHQGWFTVEGENFGDATPPSHMQLPSTYAIVCDAIERERSFHIASREDRRTGIALARFFGNRLDPNLPNFVIEKQTKKIAIIDTEHFASVVGLHDPFSFTGYGSEIMLLAKKFVKDGYMQTKRQRRKRQRSKTPVNLLL